MLRFIAWSNQYHPYGPIRRLAKSNGPDFAKTIIFFWAVSALAGLLKKHQASIFDKAMSPVPPQIVTDVQATTQKIAKDYQSMVDAAVAMARPPKTSLFNDLTNSADAHVGGYKTGDIIEWFEDGERFVGQIIGWEDANTAIAVNTGAEATHHNVSLDSIHVEF